VEDPRSLELAIRGCQGIHLSLHGGSRPDLERLGTINTVRAAAGSEITRITSLSGASVVEENCWFPETRARLGAEQAIRESGVPFTIFKASWFMESLEKFVHGKRAFVFGKPVKPWHWVAAADFARMVSAASALPAAENKTLFVYGPEAYAIGAALQRYCAIACPDVRLTPMPFWAAQTMAVVGRRQELKATLPFFRYCERVRTHEAGTPDEANALLGAPTTTLEQWSKLQAPGR
jgi:uncharacterized protein YbjT (DUF2867 family)